MPDILVSLGGFLLFVIIGVICDYNEEHRLSSLSVIIAISLFLYGLCADIMAPYVLEKEMSVEFVSNTAVISVDKKLVNLNEELRENFVEGDKVQVLRQAPYNWGLMIIGQKCRYVKVQ